VDDKHNAIEDKVVKFRSAEETDEAVIAEKVAEAEAEARRQLGFAPEQALHRR
jgi:hypothetical protein